VPLVSKPLSFACLAERLAWAGACPNGAVVRPARETEGVGPNTDASKEMTLRKLRQKVRWDILDAPLVYYPKGD
jgi:hypothetical protein